MIDQSIELEQQLERLYQLQPSEFTAARDELAKQLRSDGRRDLADQVKALRKPPVAVWLVNRLARERELDVQRLAKAGEALAKSQVELASGSSADFAEARREEQRALERLTEAAREVAGREGVGGSAIERTTETLRAASLSEEGRELLKRGRLTEELEPPGFDAFAALAGGATPRPSRRAQKKPRKEDAEAERRALDDARERVRQLKGEERELAKAAREAEREAAKAETEAVALRKRADEAHAEAEAATTRRAGAEDELQQLTRDRR
jgi:hypothetical protein